MPSSIKTSHNQFRFTSWGSKNRIKHKPSIFQSSLGKVTLEPLNDIWQVIGPANKEHQQVEITLWDKHGENKPNLVVLLGTGISAKSLTKKRSKYMIYRIAAIIGYTARVSRDTKKSVKVAKFKAAAAERALSIDQLLGLEFD